MSDDEDRDEAPVSGAPASQKAAPEAGEGDGEGWPVGADVSKAREELTEAFGHLKSAASILFQRASEDPAVRSATKEADRVVRKLGAAATPLARQLTDELDRVTRDLLGSASRKGKLDVEASTTERKSDPGFGEAEAGDGLEGGRTRRAKRATTRNEVPAGGTSPGSDAESDPEEEPEGGG